MSKELSWINMIRPQHCCAKLFTIKLTCTGLGSKTFLCGERPATEPLHGKAILGFAIIFLYVVKPPIFVMELVLPCIISLKTVAIQVL